MHSNILITGGCGFIGSNFINYIFDKYQNANIYNIDAMYYCASKNNINENIQNSNRYHFIHGNICDCDLVTLIINSYNIDCVIHFAAQSHVQNSFTDALKYTMDNIVGTHTLLEVCRIYGKLNKFIHVSTDEVYGESMFENDEKQKNETSLMCPTNPYAATKASAELIAMSYYHSFKMPIIITRGNNVYGQNQYPEKIIPLFIKLLKENNPVSIQGNGENIRSFIHVDDVCSAFEIILEKGINGQIYNIGGDVDSEYSVLCVAKKLIKLIKNTDEYDKWITYIEDRPYNDKRYFISNSKLKELGWTMNIDFDNGLNKLINVQNN
jgi:dTDP-glucose 4,6-dehydratase